ncbi:MAG: hydrogenase maturation nickel metallochaperone HypA [Bacilli bacterium]|nr:hydrogenase maturation nickel metallochaperone HypA [Bacilli bacterium]
MHELGIVVHVVKQVEELAKKNKVTAVKELTLEVGEVSGVVKEYFVDAFNWYIKRTEYMKECKLNYIVIQGITYCEDCQKTYETVKYGKECPYCHSPHTYLVTGKDVMIKDIKVI